MKDIRETDAGKASDVRSRILANAGCLPCSEDYAAGIADAILPDVIEDLRASADPEDWNDDDLRMAVGRVLSARVLGETA